MTRENAIPAVQLPNGYDTISKYLDALIPFLQSNRHWWEYHSTNFLIEDFWDVSVPNEWKGPLMDLEYTELLHLASYGMTHEQKISWPSSLVDHIKLCRDLSILRDPKGHPMAQEIIQKVEPLHSLLCSGMRDKKVHEVQRLSTLINSLCEEHNTSNVLDLGAGQGYLDYILSHVYGRTVIGVDDDTLQTCGAIRRTDKIKKVALKQGHASGHCFHINKRITAQETFASLLSQVLEETQLDSLPSTSQDWILCGLHTCGDLAPASIKHFLESDARVLVNVGCCYNRLSESDPEQPSNATPGFPMSDSIKKFNLYLGYAARALSCQSTCRWVVQPNSLEVFQQHFHRALLQFVVVDAKVLPHITDTREIIVGHLNGTAKTRGWIAYANAVFKKWNVEGPSDVKLQAYHDLFQHREKEVAILWTLRAMLASCLESLFLVDRVAYLEEKGIDVQIMPLFDPVDSPRNMCIIAKKRM